ncbi:MAG TPA: hypothetical protein VI300_15445, partial [Solirubrobacter sp.]
MMRAKQWTAAVAGVVALFAAPSAAHAQGVTNPADHPAPITVTIDGQTYTDGRDTLPGFDDEACTAIPNVQYDFANDEIQYYSSDGKLLDTAHWTEWARISSYADWKAQQGTKTPTPTPTAAATATATPAPSNNAPTSPSSATTNTTSPSTTSPSTTGPSTSTTTAKNPSTKRTTTKSSSTKSTTTKSPSTTSSTPKSSSSTTTSSSTTSTSSPST